MHEVTRYEITVSEIVALDFHRKNIMLIQQTRGDEIVALREEMAGAEGIKPPAVLHETSITRPALRNLNVDRSQDRPASSKCCCHAHQQSSEIYLVKNWCYIWECGAT